ncbi:tRNA (adenosine(37)-N6)-threonylcarbamoyltransferase complex transferase subunit TsaD [Candidatus Bipolaricaulota bacterium]|nr:tRNA (adenosine(37)-N6)-threonylcarbamoyltransferase complex transferase subunit TsaD [Candidatus Bipolaricaulota bacterium]
MIVLGIETSCDETAVALVRDGREILVNLVYSQTDLHARYGGVVPEAASRDHLRKLPVLVQEALTKARLSWNDVDLVGVTYGPGLIGPLLVGVSYAAGVALARDVPLVGVNHLAAHLFALRLMDPPVEPPFLGLIASGGHTLLVAVPRWGEYQVVGGTRDDAAGEALDKFGRLLGLPYPAGPKIDALASEGDPNAVPFPRPMLESGLDMSFSGLKTAAVYWLREHSTASLPDLCASFLEAVVEVLVEKALRAARRFRFERIAVAGGVAANRRLREVFPERASARGMLVFFPPPELCTDNAATVAACAFHRYHELGISDPLSLSPDANLPLHGWR